MILVLVIVTASLAAFLIGCAIRAVGYASQPLHLRWELYPVPHEEPERARHGGSYFEEIGWQEKPRRAHRFGALWYMGIEVLFLRGLWEFNRRLWLRSYPFHVGLYLLTASAAAVLVAGLLALHAPAALAGWPGAALRAAYTATGYAGLALGLLGALGLLIYRLTDDELAPYTTTGDLFNLAWFIAALTCLLAGALMRGPEHAGASAFARAVLTLDPAIALPVPLTAGIVLAALLLAYIPCTHMAHFVGKYFLYHAVRWDDEPKLPGNRMEAKLAEYLAYRPTWAAPHIGADGRKTWADVATSNPAQGAKP
jgi:nitrate reductase gamma subunit